MTLGRLRLLELTSLDELEVHPIDKIKLIIIIIAKQIKEFNVLRKARSL
jgi:hypothetical protein